jgi:hypothetical protein
MASKVDIEIIKTSNKVIKVGDTFGAFVTRRKKKTDGEGVREPAKPTLRELVMRLADKIDGIDNEVKGLKTEVKTQGIAINTLGNRMTKLEDKLDRVIDLNKLKS